MRFDGYYILSDLLGIPNLGTKGQQWLAWAGKRWLLGMKELLQPAAARMHPVAVSAVWNPRRDLANRDLDRDHDPRQPSLQGRGPLPRLLSIAAGAGTALWRFLVFLFKSGTGPSLTRALPRLAVLVAAILSAAFLIGSIPPPKPSPSWNSRRGTGRAGIKGLVTQVLVGEGMRSQPEPRSRNCPIRRGGGTGSTRARTRLGQSSGPAIIIRSGNWPPHQGELEVVRGLEQKLAESNRYLASLVATAPFPVVSWDGISTRSREVGRTGG